MFSSPIPLWLRKRRFVNVLYLRVPDVSSALLVWLILVQDGRTPRHVVREDDECTSAFMASFEHAMKTTMSLHVDASTAKRPNVRALLVSIYLLKVIRMWSIVRSVMLLFLCMTTKMMVTEVPKRPLMSLVSLAAHSCTGCCPGMSLAFLNSCREQVVASVCTSDFASSAYSVHRSRVPFK